MRSLILSVCVLALVACDTTKTPTTPTIITKAPPVIVKFDADATRLGPPNGATLDTTLRWDVSGDDARCRIDQVPGQPIGNVPTSGSQQVRPGVSTTYTMTCTNSYGTVTRSVTVIVG